MRHLFLFAAVMMFITPAFAQVATETPPPKQPQADSEATRERIGSVLGTDVFRDQLKAEPLTYGDVVDFFMRPALDEFHSEHGSKYEMTDEEVRLAAQWLEEQIKQQGEESIQRWQTRALTRQSELAGQIKRIESELTKPSLSPTDERKLKHALRIAKLEQTVPHAGDAWFMFSGRKFEQYLYDNYGGGRIIHQQLGPEALDARRDLLLTLERAGKFQITDPQLRSLAYDYWERPQHPGGFHTGRHLLDFPWKTENVPAENQDQAKQ